jgi:hypothetical protein
LSHRVRRAALVLAANTWCISASAQEEEVIEDPLLHAPAPPQPAKPAQPRLWHLALYSRAGTATSWDDLPGSPKDVLESRTRVLLSAGDKPSPRLKWEIGARFDALAHAPKHGGAAYLFEARPWEAYLDVGLADRLRLKVGNQIVAWGRLDVGSAADVLGAYDVREGPVIDVDALRIPTPTATLTWFPVDAFQLDVGYTPFFTPHRFDVAGTNWSLLGPNSPGAFNGALARLRGQLDPASYQSIVGDLGRVNAPDARPDNGEAAARATWRAGPYDLAVTYGFVRSKVPSIALSPDLVTLLSSPTPNLAAAGRVSTALEAGERLVNASYDRYHQIALDLEGSAGAFVFAGEVGVSPERTLFVRDPDTALPVGVRTPVVQTGLKATYTKDESFAASLEASVFTATEGVPDRSYFVLGPHRRLGLLFGAVHKELGRHALDGAVVATTSGPSLAVVPRYGYRVLEPFVVGVGGAFFAGPRGDDTSLAAVEKGLDMVFVFGDLRL